MSSLSKAENRNLLLRASDLTVNPVDLPLLMIRAKYPQKCYTHLCLQMKTTTINGVSAKSHAVTGIIIHDDSSDFMKSNPESYLEK